MKGLQLELSSLGGLHVTKGEDEVVVTHGSRVYEADNDLVLLSDPWPGWRLRSWLRLCSSCSRTGFLLSCHPLWTPSCWI